MSRNLSGKNVFVLILKYVVNNIHSEMKQKIG